jgi:hypothetical protein
MRVFSFIGLIAVIIAISVTARRHSTFVAAPSSVAGSGRSKEEARTLDSFHAVDAGGIIEVNVLVDSSARPSLRIKGDDNVVPMIESVIRDGTLTFRVKKNSTVSPKVPLVAEVISVELDGVEASGAARVNVKGLVKNQRFTASASGSAQISVESIESTDAAVSASGAARVSVSGSTASLKVDASGASQIQAQALQVDTADVSIKGASSASLRVSKSIETILSDASQLELHGNPQKKMVSASGASRLIEK